MTAVRAIIEPTGVPGVPGDPVEARREASMRTGIPHGGC